MPLLYFHIGKNAKFRLCASIQFPSENALRLRKQRVSYARHEPLDYNSTVSPGFGTSAVIASVSWILAARVLLDSSSPCTTKTFLSVPFIAPTQWSRRGWSACAE